MRAKTGDNVILYVSKQIVTSCDIVCENRKDSTSDLLIGKPDYSRDIVRDKTYDACDIASDNTDDRLFVIL